MYAEIFTALEAIEMLSSRYLDVAILTDVFVITGERHVSLHQI